MEKTEHAKITNDTEFYGFLNGMDIIVAGKITEILRSPAVCAIYENDTFASVVEEIIRRHGTFYTGVEAKKIAPWNIMNTCIYAAKFHYIESDTKSTNPAYEDFDWCVLDNIQYAYGMHLDKLFNDGTLTGRYDNIL